MAPLKILEHTRVGPPHDSFTLPLTFFDCLWLKLPPVERVFFYRLTDSTRQQFNSAILPKLKHSLSNALRHFAPLSGRLVWDPQDPKPHIVCSQNDAVSLTVAESASDFSHLSGNEARVATELHHLVPELPISDDSSPIISLQVTYFPNQGFCIGVNANHGVLDGKTTTMFIKAWAHMCKQEQDLENHGSLSLPQDLTPFFDRTVIDDPTGLDMKLLNAWLSFLDKEDPSKGKNLKVWPSANIGSDVVRVTFELTRENIQKLKARVKNESPQEELHLSTFVITYAHMLTCLVRAKGGDKNRPVSYGFAVDYRARLDRPVQPTYFGNCVGAAFSFNAKAGAFLEEKGFVTAVKRISDLITGLGPGSSALENMPDMINSLASLQPGTQIVSVAGSTRLGVYGSDFGWGNPVKVEIVSTDKNGAVSLTETRDGSGGVEIGICLEKHEMNNFAVLFFDGLK